MILARGMNLRTTRSFSVLSSFYAVKKVYTFDLIALDMFTLVQVGLNIPRVECSGPKSTFKIYALHLLVTFLQVNNSRKDAF